MTNEPTFKIVVTMDGDQFCATLPTFINIQESCVGFGPTEVEAKLNLMLDLYDVLRPVAHSGYTGNSASCGDCESRENFDRLESAIYVPLKRGG